MHFFQLKMKSAVIRLCSLFKDIDYTTIIHWIVFILLKVIILFVAFICTVHIIILIVIRTPNKENEKEKEKDNKPTEEIKGAMTCTQLALPSVKKETKTELVASVPDTTSETFKYWKKRFSLFSKFNDGILLDEESFYSVCPEVLSKFMAEKCKGCRVAIDPFCGAGGNIIQLARLCDKVIAVDIDPKKIELAKHNAAIYGVLDKIQFIVGDFFKISNEIKGDVIVTSPPWGGPSYTGKPVIAPSSILLDKILEIGKSITPKMLLHLPKNIDKQKCVQISGETGLRTSKIQSVFLNKYLNCVLVYVQADKTNSTTNRAETSDVHLHESFNIDSRGRLCTYRQYLTDVKRFLDMARTVD